MEVGKHTQHTSIFSIGARGGATKLPDVNKKEIENLRVLLGISIGVADTFKIWKMKENKKR